MTTAAPIELAPLQGGDRARWEALARGYKTFYETVLADADYEHAWRRLLAGDGVHALGALYDKVARHDGFIRYDHPLGRVGS